jgi:hypothetical protein
METLEGDVNESYTQIRKDIESYFEVSNQEITEYFNNKTDVYLLSREKEILQEMKSFVEVNIGFYQIYIFFSFLPIFLPKQ